MTQSTLNWRIEKIANGFDSLDHQTEAFANLDEIRKDLTDHIGNLPDGTVQSYRDELTTLDYAIGDARSLIQNRNYNEDAISESKRLFTYTLYFIENKYQEIVMGSETYRA